MSTKSKKVVAADSAMDRVIVDPHHMGLLEWGWVERRQQLYCRWFCKNKHSPWMTTNRVHITPKRMAALNELING